MAKSKGIPDPLPACYAQVLPGLESVASDELRTFLRADVKRADLGVVVFRVAELTPKLLQLRTTEDVFLLAWGTDELTYRATDLESLRYWTSHDANWPALLRFHHSIKPLLKGRPTYRVVAQMHDEHGYRRVDAQKAVLQGLQAKLPAGWLLVDDNAHLEIWLNIHGTRAICGLRLSDKSMRHRTYKEDHQRASLRPTLAAAMIRLGKAQPGEWMCDPMCGVGTILAEQLAVGWDRQRGSVHVLGGDCEQTAVLSAQSNLRRQGRPGLVRWDALRLPLETGSVHCIVSNPPFGKQLSRPELIAPLYRDMTQEYDRVLTPTGRAVLLVSDLPALRQACQAVGWVPKLQQRVQVLGQPAFITLWRKPG